MLRDIETAKSVGAAGVVFGALTPDNSVDVDLCQRLLARARPLPVTFHRAFDESADPMPALDQLIALGFDRLLTSGQASSAAAGVQVISALVERASGRIKIMPGSGVRPRNAAMIVRETGATEIHGTASRLVDDGERRVTCESVVRAIREEIDRHIGEYG
jgi:copper homeostasis protein